MNQYLLLIQKNAKRRITAEDWDQFFAAAKESGFFRGGSELGERLVLGATESAKPNSHLAGYMRFDADDKAKLLDLLQKHPVVLRGGSVELCEMLKS